MTKEFNYDLFNSTPIIGIMRGFTYIEVMAILPHFLESGLGTIEITLNSPDALQSIKKARQLYGELLNIGAGTVCDVVGLELALEAGASFIVTPIVEESVIIACKKRNIPIFPGAMTPTEVSKAWTLGATMVKLFPAGSLQSDYLQSLKGPFEHVKILATGGIGLMDMERYWLAGADGFGIGSPLFPQDLVHNKEPQALQHHFQSYVARMQSLQQNREGQVRL